MFHRAMAVAALARLTACEERLHSLDQDALRNAMLTELASAELGFWAPEAVQGKLPLVRRTELADVAWPWKVPPWKSTSEPLFLWVETPEADAHEDVLRIVYESFDR